jgi:hypothetical protein
VLYRGQFLTALPQFSSAQLQLLKVQAMMHGIALIDESQARELAWFIFWRE